MDVETVTLRRPDDLHVHLRDGMMLRNVCGWTSRHFARALVMPNVPAIHTGEEAIAYRDRIEKAAGNNFKVISCIKLTHRTTPSVIREASELGILCAKLYPSGVTNASHDGIEDPWAIRPIYEAMADCGMVLCVHGEEPSAFILDREEAYLGVVSRIAREYSGLRVVLEHITTAGSVHLVAKGPPNLACTITAHHLELTLDDVLSGGIHPHHFCYPVAKRPVDREFLVEAAMGEYGDRFIFGSDSAPHRREDKESACGCAGVFSAPVAMSVLAELFLGEDSSAEDIARLQSFTSERGADFYGLPRNEGTLTLARRPWVVPEIIGGVVPFRAGETLEWQVVDRETAP